MSYDFRFFRKSIENFSIWNGCIWAPGKSTAVCRNYVGLAEFVVSRKIVLRGEGSDGLYARGVLLCTPRAFFYLVQFYEYKSS